MGSIYRAEDLRLPGRFCAIKEVQTNPEATAETQTQAQQQFLQEASILARLDHPNLPKVSDFFNQDGRDYLVMDYVPGQDLHEVCEETWGSGGRLTEQQVLTWAEQIMDAVAYLHEHDPPVLHRDIKPSNIKLTPGGRIKLVDFGLVKLLNEDETRTITVVQGRGSALYTPLEQYGGDTGHTDARSDIYALGATLYQLLTGQPPLSAKARFLNPGRMRPAHEVNPQLSRSVSDALSWAMEMHPDDRPENIHDFRQALFGLLSRPVVDEQRPVLLEIWQENRTLLLLVAGLFLLAVLLTIL